MKNLFISLLTLTSVSVASAHMITGVPVLKGSLKTKLVVNSVQTTCRVKVSEVKNLLDEDSYGNPAYVIEVGVSLSGNDFSRNLSVKFDKDYKMTNLHSLGNSSIVKDFEYYSLDGAKLTIKNDGRLARFSFLYGSQNVNCSF